MPTQVSLRSLFLLGVCVVSAACQAQAPATNPSDPQILATVEAMLEKAVAGASAADAEAALSISTKDGEFTFITGDTMLTGYDEALAVAQFKKAAGACLEARGYSVR